MVKGLRSLMIEQLFSLKNKTCLITGSSRGLGFTLAKGLGKAGAKIILNGVNPERLEQAVAQLKQEQIDVSGVSFDVSDEKAVSEKVNQINDNEGPVDILVNNAGIQIRSPLQDFKYEDWQRILAVNLSGAFLVSKYVVPQMISRKQGKIINICSIQSELARPTIAPYTAAKGGLRNLTRGMATDWGKYNIQVNGIAPGYFKTEMTKALYSDEKFDAWLCSRVPANRWGNPDELIAAAIFLASKGSDYVNGHLLFVDGGLKACV
jgi:gluconate 5-dehydrogenase